MSETYWLKKKMQKLVENTDYQLIPQVAHEDAWAVRFLTGPFVETVVAFGAVSFNEVAQHLSFNFTLISSPDENLTESNVDLQEYCARILEAIIEAGLDDGSVVLNERKKE